MPDAPQSGTLQDDDLDFRPLAGQSTHGKPAAQARPSAASDGIDFQPANATAKRQRPAPSDGIDFRAPEKPVSSLRTPTLDELTKGHPAGTQIPSLTDQAAALGDTSSLMRTVQRELHPAPVDLTKVPINPFTNRYVTEPPMLTEEEKHRTGTISPRPSGGAAHGTPYEGVADLGERLIRAVGVGAPEGSKMAEWTGQRGTKDNPRLFAPEALMTEAEQERHPVLAGAGEFAGGMTSPENLMLLGLTAGAGELAGPGAAVAKRLLSAGFSMPMLVNAARMTPEIADAFRRGDTATGERLLTQAVLSAATAGLAGRGMFEEAAPTTVPRGTISPKLMMDDATTRGMRRMQDFAANDAARRGMGNLSFAERAIEAAKQARINEPAEIPPTRGEPAILQGRPHGPERNPLEVEAERVREEQSATRPDFRVIDLRRVTPENPEEPPYYEIAGPEHSQSRLAVEPAQAGETVGARGRSAAMTDVAARTLPRIENSLQQRFEPDVLEDARQELNNAAGLAGSFERPGRYFAQYGDQNEYMPSRSTNAAKGIHAGGLWYGVSSARPMIEDMHPWFRGVAEGPETFAKTVEEGKGAAYDRLLEAAATHIQAERESARPVVEEFAPQLRTLAGQVRDVDPELAETLESLAQGKSVGFGNLREYIQGKIHDAETAAQFSRTIDEAADEARNAAGTEEVAQPGPATREPGGGVEAPTRESAPAIDFEPSEPINPQEVEDMSRLLGRPVTAEELPGIRRRLDAERNISEGLRGNRRDTAGEIREEHRSELERQTREPGEEPAERYSGLHPRVLVQGARALQRAWSEKIAQPFIDRVAKIGDKYIKAREADPAVAEGLHLLDNAPHYLRAKAAQEVHNVIGNLSRAQERLFVLMADADSRENLRANHPEEYAQAQRDPAVQEALRKYRPLERELTSLRERMGGVTIDDDYLRRVYDKYVAGVGHAEAPGTPERGTSAYDRVIRPQRIGNVGREAESEYYYQHGLHEFGPSFATKFIGTHLRALRDSVAREFMNNATFVRAGESEPRFILYNGERYYRPDVAREMRDGGVKHVRDYDRYDPTAGEKFPVPAEGKYLGPREVVKTINDFGRREESEPGAVRRFFQEQILGFGFGVPHIANIMRRVSQSVPGGAANPKGWVDAWRVVLSKELRSRGIAGLNDPTFDKLAQRGSIPTSDMANLKEYWGGNLNPANWARRMAAVGHRALFEPGSLGGFGGLDQRARLYIADLVRSQRPELSDSQIAEAVRTQLGDYNRANWSGRQKMLSRFMMFPGWDFSSIRWVLQHPIKTTVPPALVVFLANQALNKLGQNRAEDKYDIGAIHVGDRAYSTSLLRESVARNLFRPALAYAQAKVRGESDQRAMAEAGRGVTSGAGGLLGMLRPDLSGFLALAANRQGFFSSKEIVSKDDYAQPGKLLPSRAIEKQAVFALRKAVPALDRMLDSNEETDLRSFAGGNLGVPNYRDDAEKRLLRNASEAEEVHRTIGKLAKSNPNLAREYVKDPDNAAFALFYHDLSGLSATLKRMDEAKQRIDESGLPGDEKKARAATIDKARENLLRHADGLNNLLFKRRQQAKAAPGTIPRSLSEDALRVLQEQR